MRSISRVPRNLSCCRFMPIAKWHCEVKDPCYTSGRWPLVKDMAWEQV